MALIRDTGEVCQGRSAKRASGAVFYEACETRATYQQNQIIVFLLHNSLWQNYALLGYYAESGDNYYLPTLRDNLSVPSSSIFFDLLTLEDGTDMSYRNFGN